MNVVGGGSYKTLSHIEGPLGFLNGGEGGSVATGVVPPVVAGKNTLRREGVGRE